jgi:hypothetical protein
VVKVFELAIARTGLQEEKPRKAGSDRVPISPPFWITKLIIVAPRKSFFESAEIKVLDNFRCPVDRALEIGNLATSGYFRDSPLTQTRDGTSRGIGFEIGKEFTRCRVALGINADDYR